MEDKTQERLLKECVGQVTLLQYATRENIPQAVQLILEKGGDPNYAHDNAETPIHMAARCGYPEILKMLLENSNRRTRDSIGGNSPLHSVAKYAHDSPSHHECLKMLLEKRWGKEERFDVNAVVSESCYFTLRCYLNFSSRFFTFSRSNFLKNFPCTFFFL